MPIRSHRKCASSYANGVARARNFRSRAGRVLARYPSKKAKAAAEISGVEDARQAPR
jgi:hypothetical protein